MAQVTKKATKKTEAKTTGFSMDLNNLLISINSNNISKVKLINDFIKTYEILGLDNILKLVDKTIKSNINLKRLFFVIIKNRQNKLFISNNRLATINDKNLKLFLDVDFNNIDIKSFKNKLNKLKFDIKINDIYNESLKTILETYLPKKETTASETTETTEEETTEEETKATEETTIKEEKNLIEIISSLKSQGVTKKHIIELLNNIYK